MNLKTKKGLLPNVCIWINLSMDKIMYNSDKIAWVSYLSMIEFNKG